jgi:hypothetical protein
MSGEEGQPSGLHYVHDAEERHWETAPPVVDSPGDVELFHEILAGALVIPERWVRSTEHLDDCYRLSGAADTVLEQAA